MNLAIDLVVYLISHGLIVGYHHEWVLPASRAILSPPLGLHQWPGVDKHTVHWCSKSKWQTEASGGLCGLEWDLGGKVNRSTRLLLWIFASCSHRGVWARLKSMKSLKYMDIYEKVGVCMFSWGVRREHTHSIRFSELSVNEQRHLSFKPGLLLSVRPHVNHLPAGVWVSSHGNRTLVLHSAHSHR